MVYDFSCGLFSTSFSHPTLPFPCPGVGNTKAKTRWQYNLSTLTRAESWLKKSSGTQTIWPRGRNHYLMFLDSIHPHSSNTVHKALAHLLLYICLLPPNLGWWPCSSQFFSLLFQFSEKWSGSTQSIRETGLELLLIPTLGLLLLYSVGSKHELSLEEEEDALRQKKGISCLIVNELDLTICLRCFPPPANLSVSWVVVRPSVWEEAGVAWKKSWIVLQDNGQPHRELWNKKGLLKWPWVGQDGWVCIPCLLAVGSRLPWEDLFLGKAALQLNGPSWRLSINSAPGSGVNKSFIEGGIDLRSTPPCLLQCLYLKCPSALFPNIRSFLNRTNSKAFLGHTNPQTSDLCIHL